MYQEPHVETTSNTETRLHEPSQSTVQHGVHGGVAPATSLRPTAKEWQPATEPGSRSGKLAFKAIISLMKREGTCQHSGLEPPLNSFVSDNSNNANIAPSDALGSRGKSDSRRRNAGRSKEQIGDNAGASRGSRDSRPQGSARRGARGPEANQPSAHGRNKSVGNELALPAGTSVRSRTLYIRTRNSEQANGRARQ
eukprot:824371-Prorocentrum_minimum.AAC.2